MSPEEEFKQLLTQTQQYLAQQKELYGDVMYRDATHMVEEPPPGGSEHIDDKPPEQRTSAPTMVADSPPQFRIGPAQENLFGGGMRATIPQATKTAASLVPYPNEPWVAAQNLDQLNGMISSCTKCSLGHTRKNFVFGVGNPHADVVLVGEAPGADEDEKGEPFVGRAGQLLNKILEAIHFKREEVFICNILKCRPPNNRDPQPNEIDLCEPHLWKQLELIKPKMILCLGRIAGQALLKTTASLSQLRGTFHDYRGIKLMVTYHPAALLRNPNWKRPAWEDVQLFRKKYDEIKLQLP